MSLTDIASTLLKKLLATLAERHAFDEAIDVRTPAEYAEDHLPGAINAPVLGNEERVVVGTLYKQDPFAATRLGAAMVARNIARHLDGLFADRPRNWRPLVYCWRGGKRSGSMATWLNLIGWKARQLDGGYQTYRRWVVAQLEQLPQRHRYVVLTGHTGAGKTRLLQALAQAGGQVVDLEGLACHRGSLLGAMPDQSQPSQKAFDGRLIAALDACDVARPIFIEAESKRIGAMRLPDALMQAMRHAPSVRIEAARQARVDFLLQDYAHLFDSKDGFKNLLAKLAPLHGWEMVERWQQWVDAGEAALLFGELIDKHYDPAYRRSSPDRLLAEAARQTVHIEPAGDLAGVALQLVAEWGG